MNIKILHDAFIVEKIKVATLFFICMMLLFPAQADEKFENIAVLEQILNQEESQLDLATIKLSIDKMIDPKINIERELSKIDKMVATIEAMLPKDASAMDKMLTIKKYIYTPGAWNNNEPYHYDFDDPLGTKISNKLLANYIANKKGNCITMPILFIILGDKLGIDTTAAVAPLHVFVKFTDTAGKIYNLETTSGANFTRDIWYRQQMSITDKAVESGIYLKKLSKKETIVVMMEVLGEYYSKQEAPYKMAMLSDLSLKYYPLDVNAMLRLGTAYSRILRKEFITKYPNPKDIPLEQRELFHFLANGNRYWFAKAEGLGWREPNRDDDEKYLETIKQTSSRGGM